MLYYIFGTSGFAKEVEFIIKDNNKENEVIFVSEHKSNNKNTISEKEFFEIKKNVNCVLAIGNVKIRKKIFDKVKFKKNINFPNIIHKSAILDLSRNNLGYGNIICPGSILTTNINLNNFIILNLNSTVGHDTSIDSYTTVSPGVNISGKVKIEQEVFFGTNCCCFENITIANKISIGAGSVITKSLLQEGVYLGIPAKKI